ncbi:MAG: von Willebrand factor type A domain-containing protein [Thermoanaerobaculia bacterium]
MNAPRTPQHESDLERELRSIPDAEPPAGLAARIKLEIPAADELRGAAGSAPSASHRTPWLRLAATLAFAAVAATVAWRTIEARRDTGPGGLLPSPPASAPAQVAPRELEENAVPSGDRDRDARHDAPVDDRSVQSAVPPQDELGKVAVAEPKAVREKARYENPAFAVPAEPAPALREQEVAASSAPASVVQPAAIPEAAEKSTPGVRGGAAGAVRPAPPARQMAKPTSRMDEERFARQNELREEVDVTGHVRDSSSSYSASATAREPDTMIFRDAGTHRFVLAADDPFSTFALDVDTGSYTLARSYIERGLLPPAAAIRIEEFVNAMPYRDPAPRREEFALVAEGAASPYPDAAGLQLLRFAVKAREVDQSDRKPANLTFVVDVSGSMNRENRLGLVKRSLGLLLDELTPEDRVALAVYGSQAEVLLRPTRDHAAIRAAIDRLAPGGSTNAEAGLRVAYELADEAWERGAINRIVLCSDGVANVGATGPETILARIGEEARKGIQLTTIGFGMGNYNDALMEKLADAGDGSYHYVDGIDEARRVFVENLTGTLQTVAKDAKIQVEFDPASVLRWRLLGYENRDVADRDFRNDAVDAGEVGAGQSATALYEIRLQEGVRSGDRIATLRLRWKSVDGRRVLEAHRELTAGDIERHLHRGNRDLRLAAVAAMFAERLKSTRAGIEVSWPALTALSGELRDEFPRDAGVRDLDELIRRASRLSPAADDDGNGRLDE